MPASALASSMVLHSTIEMHLCESARHCLAEVSLDIRAAQLER